MLTWKQNAKSTHKNQGIKMECFVAVAVIGLAPDPKLLRSKSYHKPVTGCSPRKETFSLPLRPPHGYGEAGLDTMSVHEYHMLVHINAPPHSESYVSARISRNRSERCANYVRTNTYDKHHQQ